jgi:hypothetical protein
MIFQTSDSLELTPEEPIRHVDAKPRHPYQVLRSLPYDATPAQQDSAIQATFQPKDVHYSSQPDTLHLPGAKPGKNLKKVNIPQYYKESFFSNDSLFHPELNGGRCGVVGDPVPYTASNDNVVTGMLLACFILAMVSFAHSRKFVLRQTKNFFYAPNSVSTDISETSREVRFLLFLVFHTSLLLSILYFFYSGINLYDKLILSSPYQLLAIYVGIITLYFVFKVLLYTVVNWTFFDKKKNGQWMHLAVYVTAMTGVCLYPLVLLLAYFNLSMQNTITYFLIVIVLSKILLFYKCYSIFFRKIGGFLQIILYFCALEVVPLLVLWGVLVFIGNYLKINF